VLSTGSSLEITGMIKQVIEYTYKSADQDKAQNYRFPIEIFGLLESAQHSCCTGFHKKFHKANISLLPSIVIVQVVFSPG
jgi:hypothetical protein